MPYMLIEGSKIMVITPSAMMPHLAPPAPAGPPGAASGARRAFSAAPQLPVYYYCELRASCGS